MSTQRRSPMRMIVMLLLLIAGGAIVNVAVAWGICAALPWYRQNPTSNAYRVSYTSFATNGHRWIAYLNQSPSQFRVRASAAPTCGNGLLELEHLTESQWSAAVPCCLHSVDRNAMGKELESIYSEDGFDTWEEVAAGWPRLSVHYWLVYEFDFGALGIASGQLPPAKYRQRLGLFESPQQFHLRNCGNRLPYAPLWPGFAINTIFYAAILWLLFFAPGFIRRRLRIHRGNCPACGYHIAPGTSNACSECGAAVPSRMIKSAAQ